MVGWDARLPSASATSWQVVNIAGSTSADRIGPIQGWLPFRVPELLLSLKCESETMRETPEEILSAFKLAKDELSRFRWIQRRACDQHIVLITEAQIRLSQAAYFLAKFRELEPNNPDGWTRASGTVASDVLKAHGEAFYYFAFRAREALSDIQGFDFKFDPLGVRNVRNLMLEHPDDKHGLYVPWWETDCDKGLILSPCGEVGQKGWAGWADKGLYPNAQEFIDKLLPKVEAALNAAEALTSPHVNVPPTS